jgi:hypothetical protein
VNLWTWLESTALALWVAESDFAYPLLLALHIFGLALAVGIRTIIDMSILGTFPEIRPVMLRKLFPIVWIALALNMISGLMLFISQATLLVNNLPFLTKISLIILQVILTSYVFQNINIHSHDLKHRSPIRIRLLAMGSLVLWLGIIIAGRLIAYVGDMV